MDGTYKGTLRFHRVEQILYDKNHKQLRWDQITPSSHKCRFPSSSGHFNLSASIMLKHCKTRKDQSAGPADACSPTDKLYNCISHRTVCA